MYPVPTAFLPASSDPNNLNILHQTRVYAVVKSAKLEDLVQEGGRLKEVVGKAKTLH